MLCNSYARARQYLFQENPMDIEYSRNPDNHPNTSENSAFGLLKTDEIVKKSNEKKKEITMKILESSKRSVRLLRDANEIAVSACKELHCQSEQMFNTEKRLDALNSSLKKNQQLMNKIKSPFGAFKNFVKNKQDSVLGWKNRIRVESTYPKSWKSSPHGGNLKERNSHVSNRGFKISSSPAKLPEKISSSIVLEQLLDDDLDEISCSVARLKNLALEMNGEVVMQNEHLDHIINKSENVSVVLKRQNKSIKQMIG